MNKKSTQSQVVNDMRVLYDRYFKSADYQRRYPQPNQSTLAFVMRHGCASGGPILDMGCGNGRYSMALLQLTQSHITACDISSMALCELETHLATIGPASKERVSMLHCSVDQLPAGQAYSLLLLLFGVLSHAGARSDRIAMLQSLRSSASNDARLILSVPSMWRRRPLELLQSLFNRKGAYENPWQLGDIRFSRQIDGQPLQFFYHLYTLSQLRTELHEAGWEMLATEPESALPEWLITQHPLVEKIDRVLQILLPSSLGYGIRVAARPITTSGNRP